jgi:hypothetical protein
MRLTLDIPDEVHARLKARAKEEGTTMRAIVLRAIEAELHRASRPAVIDRKKRFEIPVRRSTRPGTLKLGAEGVYEYIDFP